MHLGFLWVHKHRADMTSLLCGHGVLRRSWTFPASCSCLFLEIYGGKRIKPDYSSNQEKKCTLYAFVIEKSVHES